MRVTVYRSFCGELRTVWKELEPFSQHHVFQCYEWLSYWQQTIGNRALYIRPHIVVVVGTDNQPRMIFPFGVRRQLGARVLGFLGGGQGDYQGPLIHDDWISDAASISSAWSLVEKNLPGHDVRHFPKLPAYWCTSTNPMLALWTRTFQDNSYSSNLPASFADFQEKLKPKLRADTRRQRRRLSEIGTLKFQVIDESDKHALALDVMIEQKRQRYRNTGVPDILAHSAVQQFYMELSNRFSGIGRIHFSVLMLNEEILATHWGAIHRDRFYFLMPTFAEGKWGGYSPGRLLLENLVEWCIQNGLKVFDFTIGGEEYKKDWCDSEMPQFEHLRATTPLGLFYVGYILCLRRARRNERMWALVKVLYGFFRYGKA